LAPGGSLVLAVGSGTITGQSGNNVAIGTVAAANSANPSGSAAPVNVIANVYETFSGSTSSINSGTSATLDLTTLANDDGASGQRAGVTINGWATTNSNFVVTTGTTSGGAVGNATGGNNSTTVTVGAVAVASNALSGTYNYTGSITGSASYTNAALQSQGGANLVNPTWSGITLSATVSATGTYGQTNTAFIQSGSSMAGYGFTSSQGNHTTATLLGGTASTNTNLSMQFTAHGTAGEYVNPFQASDTLTLTGLHQTGGTGLAGATLTDPYVLQMTVTNPTAGVNYFLGWWDPFAGAGLWVNAIAGNSNANLPGDYGLTGAYDLESYAAYLAANPGLALQDQVGAYGYDSTNGVVWAVLDYDSDVEAIPEPGTYAFIFSGFGLLIGFRRLQRRRSKQD
jgi:hypothetical protein